VGGTSARESQPADRRFSAIQDFLTCQTCANSGHNDHHFLSVIDFQSFDRSGRRILTVTEN
jgi:hypothetical protein